MAVIGNSLENNHHRHFSRPKYHEFPVVPLVVSKNSGYT
jgi:hypothetical protein